LIDYVYNRHILDEILALEMKCCRRTWITWYQRQI